MESSALYWVAFTALFALPVLIFVALTIKGFSKSERSGKDSRSRKYWQGFWTGGLVVVTYLLSLNWIYAQMSLP